MGSFFFPVNPLSKDVNLMEAATQSLADSSGTSSDQRRHARAMLDAVHAHSRERESIGGQVKMGGELYAVDHQWTDKDGAGHALLYRPSSAGRHDVIEIREERASDHTFIVSDVQRRA